jgi:hypothetical protein
MRKTVKVDPEKVIRTSPRMIPEDFSTVLKKRENGKTSPQLPDYQTVLNGKLA